MRRQEKSNKKNRSYNRSISKFKLPLLLFVLTVFSISCHKNDSSEVLRIEMREGFENDQVEILLDDQLVYSGSVFTDAESGLGEVLLLDLPTGRYEITISVNGFVVSEKFKHKNGLWIVIRYDNEQHGGQSEATIELGFRTE